MVGRVLTYAIYVTASNLNNALWFLSGRKRQYSTKKQAGAAQDDYYREHC